VSHAEVQVSKLLSFTARVSVWGLLLGILYVLRAFFLLMFLTFVFAYIQAHLVQHLKAYIKSRPIRVSIVGITCLSVVVGVLMFLAPYIKMQAKSTFEHAPQYIQTFDAHVLDLAKRSSVLSFSLGIKPNELNELQSEGKQSWDPASSPSLKLLKMVFGDENKGGTDWIAGVTGKLTSLGASLLGCISSFLLALLFSFLIVLDLPSLTKSVRDLSKTKLAFVYNEVAGSIAGFGRELGRVFEAQTLIAILNTILTAIGLTALGITGRTAFLSMIVFSCSFIPIAGVFISSVPICLIGLQEGGVWLLFLSALLITCIHLIEAYILNPKIYGSHLHMNPVLVLFVLTTSGKVFGIWGFLLGLPVCTYIFRCAIRYNVKDVK